MPRDPAIFARVARNGGSDEDYFELLQRTLEAYDERLRALEARPLPVNGRDGIGITAATINAQGNLLIILNDGRTLNAGAVIGPAGAPGRDGVDGADGAPGIAGPRGERGADGAPAPASTADKTVTAIRDANGRIVRWIVAATADR